MTVPTDLDGLTLWLKGDAGITESGGDISEWADQSGNGNDFVQAGSGKPSVGATQNGLATVEFTASSSEYLSCANPFSALKAVTLLMLCKKRNNTPAGLSDSGIWTVGTSTSVSHYPWTDGTIYDSFGRSDRPAMDNIGYSGSTFSQWHVHWQARARDYHMAGVNHQRIYQSYGYFGATEVPVWATNFDLGRSYGGTAFFDGWIAEIIAFDRILSDVEQHQMLKYLIKDKWATSTPAYANDVRVTALRASVLYTPVGTDTEVGLEEVDRPFVEAFALGVTVGGAAQNAGIGLATATAVAQAAGITPGTSNRPLVLASATAVAQPVTRTSGAVSRAVGLSVVGQDLMARDGWSAGNYLSRSTNYPAINGHTCFTIAYLPPPATGYDVGVSLNDGGSGHFREWSIDPFGNVRLNLSPWGSVCQIAHSEGWYAVLAFYSTVASECKLWIRKLDAAAIEKATGGFGGDTGWTPTELRVGGTNWVEPIAAVYYWDRLLTEEEATRQMWSRDPISATNLILNWHGDNDTLDRSGTANLTLTGSLTPVDGPNELSGAVAIPVNRTAEISRTVGLAGGGPAIRDMFTDTTGTNLVGTAADIGGTWVAHQNGYQTAVIRNNRLEIGSIGGSYFGARMNSLTGGKKFRARWKMSCRESADTYFRVEYTNGDYFDFSVTALNTGYLRVGSALFSTYFDSNGNTTAYAYTEGEEITVEVAYQDLLVRFWINGALVWSQDVSGWGGSPLDPTDGFAFPFHMFQDTGSTAVWIDEFELFPENAVVAQAFKTTRTAVVSRTAGLAVATAAAQAVTRTAVVSVAAGVDTFSASNQNLQAYDADWVRFVGSGNLVIENNRVRGDTANQDIYYRWEGPGAPTGPQAVRARVRSGATGQYWALALRAGAAPGTNTAYYLYSDGTGSAVALARNVAGSFTVLNSNVLSYTSGADSDVEFMALNTPTSVILRYRIDGGAWGTFSDTDASRLTSGYAGFGVYHTTSVGDAYVDNVVVDSTPQAVGFAAGITAPAGGTNLATGLAVATAVAQAVARTATVTVAASMASATAQALAVTRTVGAVSRALGLASATAQGLPLSLTPGTSSRAIGLGSATASAFAVARSLSATQRAIGLASATAVAQAVARTAVVSRATSLATATASAFAVTRTVGATSRAVSLAAANAVAFAVTRTVGATTRTLGLAEATATGFAVSVTAVVSRTVGLAEATATGFAATLTTGISRSISIATATATAFAVTRTVGEAAKTIGLAVVSAVPFAVTRTSGAVSRSISLAVATASAFATGVTLGGQSRTIALAVATAVAQAVTRTVGAVTKTLGLASTSAVAQPVTRTAGAVNRSLALAVGSAQAFPVTRTLGTTSRPIGLAQVNVVAFTVTSTPGGTARSLGIATATAEALPVTRIAGVSIRTILLAVTNANAFAAGITSTGPDPLLGKRRVKARWVN
jgi:hypothetical protein